MQQNTPQETPLRFSRMLSQNDEALRAFSRMSTEDRAAVIRGAREIQGREDMQRYVNQLSQNHFSG